MTSADELRALIQAPRGPVPDRHLERALDLALLECSLYVPLDPAASAHSSERCLLMIRRVKGRWVVPAHSDPERVSPAGCLAAKFDMGTLFAIVSEKDLKREVGVLLDRRRVLSPDRVAALGHGLVQAPQEDCWTFPPSTRLETDALTPEMRSLLRVMLRVVGGVDAIYPALATGPNGQTRSTLVLETAPGVDPIDTRDAFAEMFQTLRTDTRVTGEVVVHAAGRAMLDQLERRVVPVRLDRGVGPEFGR